MGIPDHLTYSLRNLYAGQEAPGRTTHGTRDWSKIGKGVCQGCILSPCLYEEYIMHNAGLDESQAGIKIPKRNISNLRYAHDTNPMAEREGELKILLITVKGMSEKAGLKFNIWKTKITESGSITSWQIEGEKVEAVTNFIFLVSKSMDCDCNHENKRHLLLRRAAMTNLDSMLKSRGMSLLTKVRIVKTLFFPVVTYGCEIWTMKIAECQKN